MPYALLDDFPTKKGFDRASAAPEVQGPFPATWEFSRLARENADGRYTEYFVNWVKKLRYEAILATADEKVGLIRGGKVAEYMAQAMPVVIEPQDQFAAYGLMPRTEDETKKNLEMNWKVTSCKGNYIHFALDYKKLIDKGVIGILEEVDAKDGALEGAGPEAQGRRDFYAAVRLSLNAVLIYAERYRAEAGRLMEAEGDPVRAAQLRRIRDALGTVPLRPARSFYEAMQSLMLYHWFMLSVEENGVSVGRIDYFMRDHYEHDLAAGRLTRAEASDWIQLLMIRCNIMSGQGDSLILAGSTPDSKPFCNDLTYFVIDGVRALRQRGPQIWLRYAPGLPIELFRRSMAALRDGTSHPGFFSDLAAVPALMNAGFAKEHAHDYVSCQCVEITSAGRSANLSGHCYYNLAKPIEVLLNKGEPMIDEGYGAAWPKVAFPEDIDTGYETFEDFLGAYERYLRHLLKATVSRSNDILNYKPEIILTVTSALVEGCVEKGRPILDGGATYNQVFPNFTSSVTAADCLAAIRKAVYEDKRVTIEGLADACRRDFDGDEGLRLYLLNRCPKYGNDDPKADDMAKFVYDTVADELSRHVTAWGDAFAPQYFALHAS
ncbi:MAG: pyruvate formate lyase family protein, partial [Oscillospiraceae bacterium]|nr:pyruvate formate lyase family protein [Oscillospiraceae bacterium]